jgi:hypothetical protein
MSASPVYGKQYIRFAESGRVDTNVAIDQFVLVTIDNAPVTVPPTAALMAAAGEAWGVIQQKFNLATSGFATDLNRQATIATSGLLLVQANGANMQAQNDALLVDATGKSSSAGGAVTQNGTTPVVRQAVQVGGLNYVLVSFS